MTVTDQQVRTLSFWLEKEASLTFAATKAGMDRKTARKYRNQPRPGTAEPKPARTWSTRSDPFADVWNVVETLLEQGPGWEAKTLFEELQRRYPNRFADGQLRTLQRRVKKWLATRGPDKEIFFTQDHPPGRLCASDFTHMNDIGVTLAGESFPHMLYHFVLTHSNWEHATICFSESFESFCDGFQNAVWALGGVPSEHRSDRMTLAVQASGTRFFTRRYEAAMSYYGVTPRAINAGKGHENGDVEQSHHRFKRAVEQALLLRGNRDFPDREAYAAFLRELCDRRNAKRKEQFIEEQKHLRPLPPRRLDSFHRVTVRVQSGSTVTIAYNAYSVPARLIGEKIEARLYAETIELWYAGRREEVVPRLCGRYRHRINYRHVIEWLVRKPGAFAGYRYRAEMFPTSRFRMAYDHLAATASGRSDREYLAILHLAARHGEAEVDEALRCLLDEGNAVSLSTVESLVRLGVAPTRSTDVSVASVDLAIYDELFTGKEAWDESGQGEGRRDVTPDGPSEGVAFADDAGIVPVGGGTGATGVGELRELLVGPGDAGVRRAGLQASGATLEGLAIAAGEDVGDVRFEASADEGATADADAAHGRVPGSQ